MGWGWGWPWAGMIVLGPIMMLLPVLLVVVLVYALTDRGRPAAQTGSQAGALALAERRYAAGELTRDEFLRIKQDLTGGRRP